MTSKTGPALPLPPVDSKIMEAINNPEDFGGIVSANKFVIDRLKLAGLASDITLAPSKLGVHPCNRGRSGIHEDSVHALLSDIVEVGWDDRKVLGGYCVEEDPNDRYIEHYNKGLTNDSDCLAPVPPRSLSAGTLTNSHTVLGLRAMLVGCKCEIPSICVDGRMSLSRVAEIRPEMAKAAQSGWLWTMLSHETRAMYGNGLFEFISGAHNVSLNRQEHELELLAKMYRMASETEKQQGQVDWGVIMKACLRTKPECGEYLPSIAKFIQAFGGGNGAPFVGDLIRFHRRHVSGQRSIGGMFWEYIASASFANKFEKLSTPGLLLRYAFLKCQYRSPSEKVINRCCAFVSKGDIENLIKKDIKLAVAAELILGRCRELVRPAEPSIAKHGLQDVLTKQLGLLDVLMARFVLNKQHVSSIKFEKIESIGCHFVEQMNESMPSGTELLNPWELFHTGKKSSPDEAYASTTNMRAFDSLGNAVPVDPLPLLKSKGFHIGGTVMPKGAKPQDFETSLCFIESIDDDAVCLSGSEAPATLSVQTLMQKWSPYNEEWYDLPQNHPGFDLAAAKGLAQFAIWKLAKQVQVRVQYKPFRRVLAATDFEAGSLQLVPASMSVQVVTNGQPPASGYEFTISTIPSSVARFFFMPATFSTEVDKHAMNSPIWAVNTTEDEPNSNMERFDIEVKISIIADDKKKRGDASNGVVVVVTGLRNCFDIKKGAELLLYKAAPAKKLKRS